MKLKPTDHKREFAFEVTMYRNGMAPKTGIMKTMAYNEEHGRRRVLGAVYQMGCLARKLRRVMVNS
jgi:hypothetical protein